VSERDVPSNAQLGRAIRRQRRARRLTIEALALDAGLHPTYLSGIERGIRNPTWAKLAGVAQALGIAVSTIAQDAESEPGLCPRCPLVGHSEVG
jgi:transcriptional regulator with XRE-family HTH domain